MRVSRGGEWRNSRSAAIPMGRNGRSVKPSAQPTLVRTQHLPPPAETARDPGFLRVRGPLCVVSSCVIAGQQTSLRGSGYGHMADGFRPGGAVHRTACFWISTTHRPLQAREDHWWADGLVHGCVGSRENRAGIGVSALDEGGTVLPGAVARPLRCHARTAGRRAGLGLHGLPRPFPLTSH
jgi:hypothetical protein